MKRFLPLILSLVVVLALIGLQAVIVGCDTVTRVTYSPDGNTTYESRVPLFTDRKVGKLVVDGGPTSRPIHVVLNDFQNQLSPEAKELLKTTVSAAVEAAVQGLKAIP